MPILGNEPARNVPLAEENNENEINNGNLTYPMYKCWSSVLMKKIITLLIVKKCN